MRMLVQFVISLTLLCSTPHFLSAQLVPQSAYAYSYFPHLVDGGGWQTTFTVSNPNPDPVSVTITFRGTEGGDLYLDLGYGPWPGIEFEIPGLGTFEFAGTAAGPDVRVGWAVLYASNLVQGVATYRLLENGVPRYAVSVPAALPTNHYFSAATPDLGIAAGNIYTSEVSVFIAAESNDGSSSYGTMTLPALGKRAKLLSEIIPDLPQGFVGTVSIYSEYPANYFSALALRGDGGVYSSLPGGEAARPVHHYSVIWNVFLRLLSAGEVLTSEARPSMDRDNVKLDIGEDPVINAYGGFDGIQINLALAELLSDSESELAFLIGHELGHVYQFRTGERRFDPDNAELDADVWGLFLSLIAGYDPYAGAGMLAKMEMANGRADLQSQYTQEITSVYGSFNNRLDHIYTTIENFCSFDTETRATCDQYREIFHPHLPGGKFLTVG